MTSSRPNVPAIGVTVADCRTVRRPCEQGIDPDHPADGAPGEKARLARELTTTRQAVNKWLSGKGAPSAEITLRLLHWVVQQEQKTKSPTSVQAPAGQETQVRKSGYEKQTQVRKRG